MTYDRLDGKCRAKVLKITNSEVLIKAFWPATPSDHNRFQVLNKLAYNHVNVSRAYFERKYGVVL